MAAFSETVASPSLRRLHVWGKQNGLGAHPGAPPLRYQHENQQRTVSLATPLFGRHDELMKPPTLWQRPRPDSAVLSKLSGFGPISPRLRAADRTIFQRPLVQHDTSFCRDFGRPAELRVTALSSVKLPPIELNR